MIFENTPALKGLSNFAGISELLIERHNE